MSIENLSNKEDTVRFFDRDVVFVALDLSEAVWEKKTDGLTKTQGKGKILQVLSPEGLKNYKITLVEVYSGATPGKIWKGKRAQELSKLAPGETKTYSSRDGELTFIKTQGADNILIRQLEETGTGIKIANATKVTKTLGLSVGDKGKLSLTSEGTFLFNLKNKTEDV